MELVAGAVITVVVGAAAAVVTARLEHRRWLRAERLKAWTEALVFINDQMMTAWSVAIARKRLVDASESGDSDRIERCSAEVAEALGRVLVNMREATARTAAARLLGPLEIARLIEQLTKHSFREDQVSDTPAQWEDAMRVFLYRTNASSTCPSGGIPCGAVSERCWRPAWRNGNATSPL